MKNIIIPLIFLTVFISFQVCFGQEISKSVLIDKFGQTGCEDYGARIDLWSADVNNTPNSKGYALIRGPKNEPLQRISHREWIYGQLLYRNIKSDKFIVIEAGESEELDIELWKVPNGVEKPFEINTKWDYSLPLNKALIYYASEDDGGICPYINRSKVFVELLQANPHLRGNVVIYEESVNQFRKRKEDLLKEMSSISQNRLRFFYSKKSYSGHIELWLVPKKK